MKKFLAPVVATALILTGGAAFAEGSVKDGKGKPHYDRFAEADADKDGFLTKDEMQKAQEKKLDEMFTRTDTDKDGKLSKDEMEKGRAEMRKKWKERKESMKDGPKGEKPPVEAPDAGPKE